MGVFVRKGRGTRGMCTQRKRPNKYSQKKAVCKSGKEVSGDTKPAHILMMDLQPPVQFSSVTQSCLTLWPHGLQHARLPCPSLSPRVCLNSCLLSQWCHPTTSSSVTPSPPASIRVFSKESAFHIRCSNYWSFSFSINPTNEYSGWISFRIDWFDLFAVQGTLNSLLQHHDLKASFH